MISAIFPLAVLMESIATTALCTMFPPSSAFRCAPTANCLACWALSALLRTVLVNSSILAAVSSRLLACCSVLAERLLLPLEISPDPVVIRSAASRILATISARLLMVSFTLFFTSPNEPVYSRCIGLDKSPCAILFIAVAISSKTLSILSIRSLIP